MDKLKFPRVMYLQYNTRSCHHFVSRKFWGKNLEKYRRNKVMSQKKPLTELQILGPLKHLSTAHRQQTCQGTPHILWESFQGGRKYRAFPRQWRASAIGHNLEANLSMKGSGHLTKYMVLNFLGIYPVSIGNWILSVQMKSISFLTQRDREGT